MRTTTQLGRRCGGVRLRLWMRNRLRDRSVVATHLYCSSGFAGKVGDLLRIGFVCFKVTEVKSTTCVVVRSLRWYERWWYSVKDWAKRVNHYLRRHE